MKISIITPCFNSEKTIKRTIDSVISQKGDFELEYIIIDGKSSDRTLDIIQEYAKENKCIKFLSEKDNSMTEALNKGFKMATGEVVASINADDNYLPGALEAIIQEFKKCTEKKVIVGNCYIMNDRVGTIMYKLCPKYMTYFISNVLDCISSECQIFFRKECFEQYGYFNEKLKYTQDLEFYLRLLNNKIKFYYINVDLAQFYMGETNYSMTVGDKMADEVKTYIEYKTLHNIFTKNNKVNQLIRLLLGIRKPCKEIK